MAIPASIKKEPYLWVVLVVLAVFFASKWLMEGAWFLGDIITFTAPMEQLLGRAQAVGNLALWSPELGAGYPAFANGQVHFFYLPHMVLRVFLTGPQLVNVSLLLHTLWAAAGMYWLLRSVRLSPATAAVSSLLFVWGGAYSARLGLFNFVTVLSWLPVLLWLVRLWLVEGRRRALVGVAVALSMLLYAGNPQAMAIVLMVLGLQVILLIVWQWERWRRVVALGVPGLIALLLASPVILSTLEFLPATDRSGSLPSEVILDTSFPWRAWRGVVAIHPFGHAEGYQGPKGESEVAAFLGVGAILAAVIGLGRCRQRRELCSLGVLLVMVGLVLALGEYSEVSTFLLLETPLSSFATPARYFFLVHVGLVLLAAAGLEWLFARIALKSVVAAISLLVLLPPVVYAWTFEDGVPWEAVDKPALAQTALVGESGRWFAGAYLADNAPAGNFGVMIWDPVQKLVRQSLVSPYEVVQGVGLRLSRPQEMGGVVEVVLENGRGEILGRQQVATEKIIDGEMLEIAFEQPVVVGKQQLYLSVSSSLNKAQAPRLYIHTNGEYEPTGHLEACVGDVCQPVATETGPVDMSFIVLPEIREEVVVAQEMLGPNVAAGYGLMSAQWTGSLPIREHTYYMAAMEKAYKSGTYDDFRARLNRIGVKWITVRLLPRRELFQLPELTPVAQRLLGWEEVVVLENEAARPRLTTVARVEAAADEYTMIDRLGQLPEEAVVANVPSSKRYDDAAEILEEQFEDAQVRAVVQSKEEVFLVLRDTYLVGWKVYVDEVEVPLYRVDGMFRGVEVPRGLHEVRFAYEPAWPRKALLGVSSGILLLIGTVIWTRKEFL